MKPDGTRWRTGGEVKGKLANGVGNQHCHATLEHGVSSITTADATPRLPVIYWTDAPADLNGLVGFAEGINLVSARVPSHFKRSLTTVVLLQFHVLVIRFRYIWIGWNN
jgi:hypothetical protein